MDATTQFNQSKFSDVALKFGGQEVCVHKVVLASQSSYFEKLFDPLSPFAEKGQRVVTLEGDNPDALMICLRTAYGANYPAQLKSNTATLDVKFNLDVHAIVDKYDLVQLRETVLTALKTALAHFLETGNRAFALLQILRDRPIPDDAAALISSAFTARVVLLCNPQAYSYGFSMIGYLMKDPSYVQDIVRWAGEQIPQLLL